MLSHHNTTLHLTEVMLSECSCSHSCNVTSNVLHTDADVEQIDECSRLQALIAYCHILIYSIKQRQFT